MIILPPPPLHPVPPPQWMALCFQGQPSSMLYHIIGVCCTRHPERKPRHCHSHFRFVAVPHESSGHQHNDCNDC